MTTSLQPIAPMEAKSLVDSGKAVLIDIREQMEHARERIPGGAPADRHCRALGGAQIRA